jgi:hypothetical protein
VGLNILLLPSGLYPPQPLPKGELESASNKIILKIVSVFQNKFLLKPAPIPLLGGVGGGFFPKPRKRYLRNQNIFYLNCPVYVKFLLNNYFTQIFLSNKTN